ncbi:phospholipase D-like domain-containing protein [Stackebrandtia nassauensis]|uniref:phospholipase D n=1 Tax=Stackebrandtia nassauensis (strain DSM 44728 / CIP 108903 / NRRL B-16338 / NBRC 102104 / LLR-40K-21) TaxID=446470 RepID=D3QAK7_STANL|nr:phospholipase D-like domain-containing protein [Stackebrandtia nassauensis]ADD42790.1 hypothetical protein Snas_3119 [Stackebrandtia nassauensis DSM 44728]
MKSLSHRFAVAVSVIAALVVVTAIQVCGGGRAEAETSGCATDGRYRVCTTNPDTVAGGQDFTIVDEVQRQIRGAKKGGEIRIAMYKLMLKRVAYDLVDAQRRGVDVKVVVGTNDNHPDRNVEAVRILRSGGVKVVECVEGCLPNRDGRHRGAMHNKFLIVRSAGGTTVTQTSSNLSSPQTEWHQNLLSIRDDHALYRYYLAYWQRLAAGSWTVGGDTWIGGDRSGRGDHDMSRAYVFPVTSGDPITAILDDVTDCRRGDDRIWVTHNITERVGVRNRLIELHNAGCDVRVVTGKTDNEEFMQSHVRGLGHLDADKVRRLRGTHNKFVVIDAKYAGQWRKVVVTGSHNLSYSALKNANDVVLRVVHNGVADEYFGYFRQLYQSA